MHCCLHLVSAAVYFSLQSVQLLIGASFLPAGPHLTLWLVCVWLVCVWVCEDNLPHRCNPVSPTPSGCWRRWTNPSARQCRLRRRRHNRRVSLVFGFNERKAMGWRVSSAANKTSCMWRETWLMYTSGNKGGIKSHLINPRHRRLSSARLFRSSEPQRRCRGPGSCLWKQNKVRIKKEKKKKKSKAGMGVGKKIFFSFYN